MNKTESGKGKNAGSHWELNPGPLTSATNALTSELRKPNNHQHFTILYVYCTSGTECFSRAPGSHYVCAVRTPLGVYRKHLSIGSKAIQVVCNNAEVLMVVWLS